MVSIMALARRTAYAIADAAGKPAGVVADGKEQMAERTTA
jgi:hypothetical protein